MNPLSPFTYTLRHKRQAVLLMVMVAALTLGVYVVACVLHATLGDSLYSSYYLTRMSLVSGDGISDSSSGTIAGQIRAYEGVAHVIPENGLSIYAPLWNGGPYSFLVLGITETDLPVVMEACDLQLKAGRLVRPRAREIVLTEKLAHALNLQIGDHVGKEINEDYYSTIAAELTLVGILESSLPDDEFPVQTGFVSYEYLDSHELYQPRSSKLLVIPYSESRETVDDFLETLAHESRGSASVNLETYNRLVESYEATLPIFYGLCIMMALVVAVIAALVVSTINQIAVTQRSSEIGLLHAVGYSKRHLIRRLVLESAVTTCGGWSVGLVCGITAVTVLNNVYAAQGLGENLAIFTPFLFTLPLPLGVIAWINVSVGRLLNRLDAVAVIERGKLSMEEHRSTHKSAKLSVRLLRTGPHLQGPLQMGALQMGALQMGALQMGVLQMGISKPLSALTFFARHRRRGLLLVAAVGLMVLCISFIAFLFSVFNDSMAAALLSYTSQAGIVSSSGSAQRDVDPTILAQIKAHPAVAHVIPARVLSIILTLPPVTKMPLPVVYAVREQDLSLLLDVYDLQLSEGTLMQPRSNQIVLTRALAQNRGVHVGDTVGGPAHEEDGLPTEMTIVGLLDSTTPGLGDHEGYDLPSIPRWAGFASYEFVESHERFTAVPVRNLIIPVAGRESEMETWLEESLASSQVTVETLGTDYRYWREHGQGLLLSTAITEIILAIAAAMSLAILNYIFFTQRRDEFGILHAVGYSRLRLIARALQESVSVVSVAWFLGAALCVAGLLYVQATVYTPLGIRIDLYNPAPWLFTFPIPIAVVVASVGAIAWALSRLDPVTVVEGR